MALDPLRYCEEVRMEWLVAMYVLAAAIGIVVLGVVLLGYRVIHGIRVYFRFCGTRLVTCPETHETAVVGLAARSMGMEAILDEPCLRLGKCSCWPKHEGCGQGCLRQIEARPSELRFSATSRAS
jgi:hypothetical protein